MRWKHTSLAALVFFLTAPPWLGAEAPACQSVAFAGAVVKDQAFEKEVGPGVVFRLAPSLDPATPGWTIEMRSQTSPEKDFLWVA
ncbi:MAG: hypothetical protein ACRD4D_06675, partial [Candidatus Acidiferrales bacterium]